MSVLIKDMEMPEHCGYCRFRYDGICHALQKTQYSIKECPLVSVNDIKDAPTAEPGWIPFTKRELTAEEQEEHPEWCYIMDCPLPEENQEILVSNGKWVWLDTFCVDDGCYLDSDHELEGCAWMPLPTPWKGENDG